MRITVVSNFYFPEMGAASNRIRLMCEGLSQIGHDVGIVCPLPNYPAGRIFKEYRWKLFYKEKINNISVLRLPIFPSISKNPIPRVISMFSFSFSLLFSYLTLSRSDLIIVQSPPLPVATSVMMLQKIMRRKRVLLNVSDLWPDSAVELGIMRKGTAVHRLMSWMERYNYSKADAFLGQSFEILNHIEGFSDRPKALYRNISPLLRTSNLERHDSVFRIVYAGLLGHAQGIASLITHVNLPEGIELHIYGKGGEEEEVSSLSLKMERVFYHGSVNREELIKLYSTFDYAIIPLQNPIKGAVPSKLYECVLNNLPVVFMGGGEGAEFVKKYEVGVVVSPGDFEGLSEFLETKRTIPKENLIRAKKDLDFDKQIEKLDDFIHSI